MSKKNHSRLPDHGRTQGRRGATLLETCVALALSSLAALAVLGGLRPLSCALRVEAARTTLIDALLEARRAAYEGEDTVAVAARAGDRSVVVVPPGSRRPLGDDVTLTTGPADGDIQFRSTGLADNATLAIACGAATASVVVNQRGVIR